LQLYFVLRLAFRLVDSSMFTPEERAQLRSELLKFGKKDTRITGAAITGSLAADSEDEWSDIDLAFGVADSAEVPNVLSDWTEYLRRTHSVSHYFDVKSGQWIYRVFLFANTLQVDLAFVSQQEFRAIAPTFRLVFGKANEPQHHPSPDPTDLIGMGWLYALHVRSAIARSRLWQAEYMIHGMRDQALALACVSRGLPAIHGRGFHLLPGEITTRFESSLVRELAQCELLRAFRELTDAFLSEVKHADPELGQRLQGVLMELTEIPSASL
jgi:predicted nucleotidyltransferase